MDYATKVLRDDLEQLVSARENLIATKERILDMMKNSETFKDEDGLMTEYIRDFDKTEANLNGMIDSLNVALVALGDKGGGDI